MAGTIATAYVEVLPSTQGITSNLEEAFGGAGEKAGEKGGKLAGTSFVGKLGKALVAAGAVKGITDFFKGAINQGAELQQNIGGTQAVFGKAATDITSRATQAYKNMGLSASDYMATANKMGALFQGSGLSQVQSMQLTTKAMQRAADVASVMGIDTTAAMEAISGAAKGNFTMMDNLGVAMNATTLQAYALEKGINFDWNTASQAEKSQLAMEMFFDRTSQYAGNFAHEAESTISGSLGMLRSSWSDFLANLALGGDVRGAFRNVFRSIVTVGKNILPAIGNIFLGLWDVAKDAAKGIGKSLGNAFQNLKSTIKMNAPGLYSLMDQTWDMIKTGASAAWDGIKFVAGDAWAGLKSLWDEHGGTLKQGMSDIWTGIQTRWQSALTGLSTFWSNWGGTITAGAANIWNGIKSGFEFGFTLLTDAFSVFSSAFSGDWAGAWEGVKKLGSDAWSGISSALSTAWSGLKGVASTAWEGIKGAVSSAWEGIKTAIGWDSLVGIVSGVWSSIESGVSAAWEGVTSAVSDAWESVKSGAAWNSITSNVSAAWSAVESGVSSAWAGIRSAVIIAWSKVKNAPAWTSISSKVSEAWTAIEGAVSGAWDAITTAVSTAVEPVIAAVSGPIEGLIGTVSGVWSSISGAVAGAWETITADVTAAVAPVVSAVSGPIEGLIGTVAGVWTSIQSGISTAWEGIKTALDTALGPIKGLLDFSWSLPPIGLPKLPKLKVEMGSAFGGAITYPKLSWAAKAMNNPFLFTGATLFGAGEAGDEVLYGRAALMRDIESAVGENGSGRSNALLEAVDRIDRHLDRLGIYLDGEALVGGLAPGMNTALGGLDALTLRGLA